MPNSSHELIERLREGNRRFSQGVTTAAKVTPALLTELQQQQRPFAVILGCSDSRVPAEIVFDQSLGDLFVIRVAGNIVAPSQIGSVEFAVAQFGVRLVVVLGHSHCGAISATITELQQKLEDRSENLHSIVRRIRPVIEPLLAADTESDALLAQGVEANIHASVNQLVNSSANLEALVSSGELTVVGAQYLLSTGEVEFYSEEA